MVKYCFIALMMSVWAAPVFAQLPEVKPVDYKTIEKDIADPLSSYYYPTLLKRYLEGDSLLDLEQYRHLYYGHTFQESFSPYGSSGQLTQIRAIVQKKENPDAGDYKEIIKLAHEGIQERPFSIDLLNYLATGYRQTGDDENYARWRHNLFGVLDAILSSGDGKSAKSAFHVAEVRDEYVLVDILGFEYGGQQSLLHEGGDAFDYLTLAKNDAKLEGLFFNITRVYGSLANMFDKKPKKKKKSP